MEKKHIFTGAATAIVTPMNDSGVDYEALGKLIDWQNCWYGISHSLAMREASP